MNANAEPAPQTFEQAEKDLQTAALEGIQSTGNLESLLESFRYHFIGANSIEIHLTLKDFTLPQSESSSLQHRFVIDRLQDNTPELLQKRIVQHFLFMVGDRIAVLARIHQLMLSRLTDLPQLGVATINHMNCPSCGHQMRLLDNSLRCSNCHEGRPLDF